MKASSVILGVLGAAALIGVAVWLVVEHQDCQRLSNENEALRQKLEQMAGLVAENERLSKLVAQANRPHSLPNEHVQALSEPDERLKELLRLRGEVGVLRQQSQELEALREETRQARAVREAGLKTPKADRAATTGNGSASTPSQIEILKAEYWTENARLDVTGELRDRIRGDSLKAMAGNELKGDPEYGQTKHLTVEYKLAGVPMTNVFREGDEIVIPKE